MATNKKSSTSKTARVMNLLSKNREEPVEAELTVPEVPAAKAEPAAAPAPVPAAPVVAAPAAPDSPVAAPAPVAHTNTRPIISSMQADSAISDQVMSALESALDSELGTAVQETPAPISEPVPVMPEPEPEPVPEPVSEPATEEAPAAVLTPEPPPVVREEMDGEVKCAAPPTQFSIDPATSYVNVMETLVEEKANKYINLFGLCKCPRCVADVKALTLNRLESKYVVMKKGEVIPRISLYEGQFSAAVTAQLLTACKLVMEHPRHDR